MLTQQQVALLAEAIANNQQNASHYAYEIALAFKEQLPITPREFIRFAGGGCPKCKTGILIAVGHGIDICPDCRWNNYTQEYEKSRPVYIGLKIARKLARKV